MREITINSPGVEVLPLQEEHLGEIVELMNKEGWYYYDQPELKRYLVLNQQCFSLFKDGRVIGSLFTTNFGNQAWLGNIVVAEQARGLGLAFQMIRGVINYLSEEKNIATFRLGSVPLAIGLYKKVGFQAEGFITAQEAVLPIKMENEKINLGREVKVAGLQAQDLEAVVELDKCYFKSDRSEFLASLFNDSIQESCLGLKDRGKVVGFIMIRRRQASKGEGWFAEGPDYAYRLGPCCVRPEFGLLGFKAIFQEAIKAVNAEVDQLKGKAKMYAAFPRNADKKEIYEDTAELAKAMGLKGDLDLERVFDRHGHIFEAEKSEKNLEQWRYMESLGFHQEYFEQVMSYSPGEAANTQPTHRKAAETKADPKGIFASATPGDKA